MFFQKIHRSLKKEDGSVLALTALFLPVVLLIGGLIVDGGRLYIRHSQLQHIARQSANSGMLEFSALLEQKAADNYNVICSGALPPSICASTNIYDFLSTSDIQNLILTLANQSIVKSSAQKFALNFDPENSVVSGDIEITFPYIYTSGDDIVKIRVLIKSTPSMFFAHYLGDNEISLEAHSFLDLNL